MNGHAQCAYNVLLPPLRIRKVGMIMIHWRRRKLQVLCFGLCAVLTGVPLLARGSEQDDFRWMHGANYVASYAATDVEMWLHYDHAIIDRELGYAEKMGLNCVRVFLQSLVYHHDPPAFLAHFEDFLATADAHGLKVMPILFDSCFGVAPSLESRHIWVANPGPDRMDRRVVAGIRRVCARPLSRRTWATDGLPCGT